MPMYEYECPRCSTRFDLRRGISERDEEVTCPNCGDEHARRVPAFAVFTPRSSGYTTTSWGPT